MGRYGVLYVKHTYVSEEYAACSSDASAASTRLNDLILGRQQNNLQIQHRSMSMVLLVAEWVGVKLFPGNLCRVCLRFEVFIYVLNCSCLYS
jgi:hypothetical protein